MVLLCCKEKAAENLGKQPKGSHLSGSGAKNCTRAMNLFSKMLKYEVALLKQENVKPKTGPGTGAIY